jgi:ribosomal protein S27AE
MRMRCMICAGPRHFVDGVCTGCGTDQAKAVNTLPRKKRPDCPRCSPGAPAKQLEADRWLCQRCNAVFEAEDFCFADSRPDVNAEKREREAQRKGPRRSA